MIAPSVPDCLPRARGKLSSNIGKWVLQLQGWKITGEIPANKKLILAVAPHTSNWDFIVGVSVMLYLNLKVSFLGKDAIFRWPFKRLLENLGGIAVDRKHSHGVVGQLVEEFIGAEQLILGLAPEGTRSKTKEWKTGFLHIANQANVPVVPVSLDFGSKVVHFHQPMDIGKDIGSELSRVKAKFSSVCAKNPQAV